MSNLNIIFETETQPQSDFEMDDYMIVYDPKTKKSGLNEVEFAREYVSKNGLVYANGTFYGKEGRIPESEIDRDIYNHVSGIVKTNVSYRCKAVMDVIKKQAYKQKFEQKKWIIPFKNGDLDISNAKKWVFFDSKKSTCAYRLPVELKEADEESPLFNKWLDDLFEEEDQKTLQQFIGYAFIPSTEAQESLFIIGEAEAGKSVIGTILEAIFGKAMISTDIVSFLSDKFKLPELENKLIVYDDDLSDEALSSTGLFKKLVTNQQEIIADKKYSAPYAFKPFARFIVCSNIMLRSKYDSSSAFYRRIHPLIVKPPQKNREKIRGFGAMIAKKEAESIVLWALQGLFELQCNGFVLKKSKKTAQYLKTSADVTEHFPVFMGECFLPDDSADVTCAEIAEAYQKWAEAYGIGNVSKHKLFALLRDKCLEYDAEPANHIRRNGGLHRGYKGVKLKNE